MPAGNETMTIVIATATTNALVVAGNEVETATGIGIEGEGGIPEEEAAVVVMMGTGTRPGCASAGLLAEPGSTVRATPIRVHTSARAAGGMKGRGTVVAGGRVAEAGIVSTSHAGQTETMSGYREVRNTKEGMRDGFSMSCLQFLSSFEGVELILLVRAPSGLSNF
jgi:hypothetical protein